jgi:two-component system, NarL family, sensor histidine kinase DesK
MQISHHRKIAGLAVRAPSPGESARSEEVIASSGVTFQLWRLYQHAWLVCLIFPLAQVVREPISPWQVALRGLALLIFAAGYTWLMWPHPASQQTRARAHLRLGFLLFSALGIVALVFSLVYGPAWFWLFIGVSAIAGMLFPLRRAFEVIVLLTLLPLILTLMMHGGLVAVDLWWLLALMLLVRGLGLDMIGVARLSSAIRELHTARRELARLAVIEERERLARDLHDLLGQTLSMITLKSELAGCLITEEPERCAQELAEIERVSRRTLREVREAVAGYRQPNLICELEGAQQLLEAAGIDAQTEPLKEPLPPGLDAALAWTVREGVTNVIRHSRAKQCCIHLTQRNGTIEAEVLSDGGERRQEEKTSQRGLGLAGLRERVSALGGYLEAAPLLLQGKEHFRLRVELPLQSHAEASAFQEDCSRSECC